MVDMKKSKVIRFYFTCYILDIFATMTWKVSAECNSFPEVYYSLASKVIFLWIITLFFQNLAMKGKMKGTIFYISRPFLMTLSPNKRFMQHSYENKCHLFLYHWIAASVSFPLLRGLWHIPPHSSFFECIYLVNAQSCNILSFMTESFT